MLIKVIHLKKNSFYLKHNTKKLHKNGINYFLLNIFMNLCPNNDH